MSKENIKRLIAELESEVITSDLDRATITELRYFEATIEPFLDGEESYQSDDTILDIAKKLEISFAQNHPTAEGIMRELIATFSRMGI